MGCDNWQPIMPRMIFPHCIYVYPTQHFVIWLIHLEPVKTSQNLVWVGWSKPLLANFSQYSICKEKKVAAEEWVKAWRGKEEKNTISTSTIVHCLSSVLPFSHVIILLVAVSVRLECNVSEKHNFLIFWQIVKYTEY